MSFERAFAGPYVDQGLTVRNPVGQVAAAPAPADVPNLGEVDVYDPAGRQESGFVTHAAPPHSPNSWAPGHDYYKNNGMPGQDFFKNGG